MTDHLLLLTYTTTPNHRVGLDTVWGLVGSEATQIPKRHHESKGSITRASIKIPDFQRSKKNLCGFAEKWQATINAHSLKLTSAFHGTSPIAKITAPVNPKK